MWRDKLLKAWTTIKKVCNGLYDFIDSFDKPTKLFLCIGLVIIILELIGCIELLILLV